MDVEDIKKYILDIQVLSKEVSAKKLLEKGYSLEVIEVVLGIIKVELRDYMEHGTGKLDNK